MSLQHGEDVGTPGLTGDYVGAGNHTWVLGRTRALTSEISLTSSVLFLRPGLK